MHDINLIPQNKKNAGKTASMMIFVGLFCLVILLVFFLYYPLQEKHDLSVKIGDMNNELDGYKDIQSRYDELSQESQRLEQTAADLTQIKSNKMKPTELFRQIEKCIPKTVTTTDIQLEEGLLTIEGTAPNYKEVAQLMVNLRAIENVKSVTFMETIAEEKSGEDSEASYQKDNPQNYKLAIQLNITDIVAQMQTSGSDAEATQDTATEAASDTTTN